LGLGTQCELSFTVLSGQPVPPSEYPRWAVIGRSNVGKSSLLNALIHPKDFFRTGSRAGVTIGAIGVRVKVHAHKKAILELVDLPGFGYAERSRNLTESWNELATEFRGKSDSRYLTWIWLVDPRRLPEETDFEVMKWMGNENMILAFTKSDKVRPAERRDLEKKWARLLDYSTEKPLWTSSQSGEGFADLQRMARASVKDFCENE
jgi:GTP-binding protein